MSRFSIVAFLAFASATATHAQGIFVNRDWVTIPVNAVSETQFEVVQSAFASPANMWCAAGIYAEDVLDYPSGNIWVAQSLSSTGSGRSMIFSIAPVSPETTTYSYSLRTQGVRKSMATALGACDPFGDRVTVRTANGIFRSW